VNDRFERYRQIGHGIAYYRKKRGLSRQELATQIGLTEKRLQEIETYGEDLTSIPKLPWATQSMDILFTIADILKVEAIVFFLPPSDETFAKYRIDQ
jgi:transcriptional regulator with XRE-family HTH domain